MTSEVLKLVHPSTMMIAGPTGSGKTRFVLDLLRHKMFEVSQNELNTKDLERPFPDRLVWVYGEWQPLYQWVKHAVPESTKVDFIQNFDFQLSPKQRNLVVLDDMMMTAKGDKTVGEMFVQGSHHRNATVIYIIQNLFAQGSQMRTIHLNTQYFNLMKTNRDLNQINLFGKQLLEHRFRQGFCDAFRDATKAPHSYLLVDLHSKTPDTWKLRANIFPGEDNIVYVLKGMESGLDEELEKEHVEDEKEQDEKHIKEENYDVPPWKKAKWSHE